MQNAHLTPKQRARLIYAELSSTSDEDRLDGMMLAITGYINTFPMVKRDLAFAIIFSILDKNPTIKAQLKGLEKWMQENGLIESAGN